MGTVFYFPKLTTSATIIPVVVGDKALPESNPSTATTYTGQMRLNRRLFLFSVQVKSLFVLRTMIRRSIT